MQRLLKGFDLFREQIFTKKQHLFESLNQDGQHPRILFITCSDSRVDPALFTQCEPGEMFVIRNMGNLVPPHGAPDSGEEAAIDYAINHLGIEHIIVCGHSDCGAMKAVVDAPQYGSHEPHPAESHGPCLSASVKRWLDYAEAVHQLAHQWDRPLSHDALLKATQLNVQQQLVHLKTLPSVAVALLEQRLQLHGWVYCFESAELYLCEDDGQGFRPYSSKVTVNTSAA